MTPSQQLRANWRSSREEEIPYLLDASSGTPRDLHLRSRSPIINYIRFADEVKHWVVAGRVLDWGCGRGQMSWLLDRRNLEIVSYDLADKRLEKFVRPHIPFQLAPDGWSLPFSDASFDGVLSCGVLEHVADERASLAEIHRILKVEGYFFVYQLPQLYAYTEFLNKMRGLWYHHRRYTIKGAKTLLEEAGFEIIACHRANLFPKNLTGMPPKVRAVYNSMSRYLVPLEKVLVRVPVLNWPCHSLEFVVQKKE